jgi:hypothetical protein
MQEAFTRVKTGDWANVRAIFTFEADCIPLTRDWLDRLTWEWSETEKSGKWMTGWWGPWHSPVGHLQGNSLFHVKLAHFIPRIFGAPCNLPWDQAFATTFAPHWRKSNFLENLYQETNVAEERIKHVIGAGAVLLHGVKDASVERYADRVLRKS